MNYKIGNNSYIALLRTFVNLGLISQLNLNDFYISMLNRMEMESRYKWLTEQ